MEKITIEFNDMMLHDKLRALAAECSIPANKFVMLVIKRLVEDIEFLRNLRTGKPE